MDKVEKVTTVITRSVTTDFSDQQIEAALIKACGFADSAKVYWDIGDGYIRNCSVVETTVTDA